MMTSWIQADSGSSQLLLPPETNRVVHESNCRSTDSPLHHTERPEISSSYVSIVSKKVHYIQQQDRA